jgi:osmoprotectant transport system substrate-binding protein
MMKLFVTSAIGLAIACGMPARTTAAAADTVAVGSKIDTEGALLGHMIAALLETSGIKVENKIQLGPTKIVRSAILAGQIDIYPEYTGNGALFFNLETDPVWRDAARGYEKVRTLDRERNNLVWLAPAPANNTWAIAVRKDLADAQRLVSLADFARYVSAGGKTRLAASAEFVESPAALPAFQSAYGFKLDQNQLLVLSGGDTAATIRAAADGTSGVNAAMAYGTDGALAAVGLVVLKDDKGAQVVYEPAPVVRAAVLDRYPNIRSLLDPVFGSLSLETLQGLNAKIAVEGLDAKSVAAEYLKTKGFLK